MKRVISSVISVALATILLGGIVLTAASASETARPVTTIRLYGQTFGATGHIMSQALGQIVNKHSKWLRIDVLGGMSGAANLGVLQNDPARRTDSFCFTNSVSAEDARKGRPPFKTPYPTARHIATFAGNNIGLVTTNPAIKTIADMKGHSAHFGVRAATAYFAFAKMLEVVGVLKDTRVSSGSWQQLGEVAIDGTVEVIVATATGYPGIGLIPAPSLLQPYTSRKMTFISFTKEQVEKTRQALGYSGLSYAVVPAKSLFPDQDAFPVVQHEHAWWADEALPEDIAYELAKTIVENLSEFGTYYKAGEFMRRENIAWFPYPPNLVHPGAARYYREHNIPMGSQAEGVGKF